MKKPNDTSYTQIVPIYKYSKEKEKKVNLWLTATPVDYNEILLALNCYQVLHA